MSWNTLTAAQQDHLLRRPFDHFARYRLAAEIVQDTVGATARVLDLGGGPGSLQAFMPQAQVTSTDIQAPSQWHEQAPGLVLADGAALPFADDSFDVVVSLDTLEHVRPASRESFLNETARVAARWALVVCPYGTPGVPDADIALRAYVGNRFAPDLPTLDILDEHIGYGHPDITTATEILAAHGPVGRIPSGRLDRWFAGMITFFHLLALGDDEPVEVVQRFLNRNLYEADLSGPSYRHGLLLRTGDDARTPDEVLQPLLQRAADHPHSAADLSLLTAVLGQELMASTATANALARVASEEADSLRAQLEMTAEAERQSRQHAEGLAAARAAELAQHQQLQQSHDELARFRDTVLSHPVVRLRDLARRVLDR